MIFLYPLKPFERIWDRIEKSKGLTKMTKNLLLVLLAITMIAQSFGYLWIIKSLVDLISVSLGHSPP